jgi:hypothetical protein
MFVSLINKTAVEFYIINKAYICYYGCTISVDLIGVINIYISLISNPVLRMLSLPY